MAFSVKNILDIIQGQEPYKPSDNNILLDVVTICAMRHANFMQGLNPNVVNDASESYRTKMMAVANMVKDRNHQILTNLLYQGVIVLGNTKNIADFENKDTNQWAVHLTASMTDVFQNVAKVTEEEKQSYNQENPPQE
jgi:hypothetical protein